MSLPTWRDLAATADYIAACQHADGAIPWEPGGHTDPWDHTECAMALTTTGRIAEAEAAYAWLRATQRPDGSWPARLRGSRTEEAYADTNHAAYVAVGVWHHWLVRASKSFVETMWPTVRAGVDFAVARQLSFGGFAWAVGSGGPAKEALLTGTSSIRLALECAERLAGLLGEDASRWSSARALADGAVRCRETEFADKRRFSMDWYYPVLSGAVRGPEAATRLAARWEDFVVPGLGIRCVDDHPWVTGAETCELALALEAVGDRGRAAALVDDIGHLRDEDGSYHTGFVFTDGKRWPVERSTWTAAAVILAVDSLTDETPGAAVFR